MKKIHAGVGAFPRALGVVQHLNPCLPELVPSMCLPCTTDLKSPSTYPLSNQPGIPMLSSTYLLPQAMFLFGLSTSYENVYT